MRRSTERAQASELVPLAERLRYMRIFRSGLVVAIGALGVFAPEVFRLPLATLAAVSAGYLVVSLAADALWHVIGRRGISLFGALLIFDAIYLAWVSYVSGGTTSPLRYAVVLHLIAVVMLASYRTGLKLALWHSLLVLVVFYARDAKVVLTQAGHRLPDSSYHRMVSFIVAFWLVAIVTAALSAVNERELRRRKYDLEALAQMAAALDDAADARAVAHVVLDNLTEAFALPRAALLVAGGAGEVSVLAQRGDVAIPAEAHHHPGPASVLTRSGAGKATLRLASLDPGADPWLDEVLPHAHNVVVLPLSAEGQPIGALVVEHQARAGSRIERRVQAMLERFASHAALALRNAWLLEQVQVMAATDGLTGVANRRSFDAALERELSRAARAGAAVSLVMFDIDHFKALNDVHGHLVGDEVLRRMAAALADNCRAGDTLARYGGEEFALILPDASPPEALAMAERQREVVAATATIVALTTSAGVASCYPAEGGDAEGLIRAADGALYESKRAGRNRVSQAQPTGAATPEREATAPTSGLSSGLARP